MRLYGLSHPGKVRRQNQDSFVSHVSDEQDYFLVCDGMGGHHGGDVASLLACDVYADALAQPLGKTPTELRQTLGQIAQTANEAVWNTAEKIPELDGMGTTAALVLRQGKIIAVSHIGDSRCYLFRNGSLLPLTRDHSLVQEMADRREILPDEMATHRFRHVITRVIGSSDYAQADTTFWDLCPGDLFLVCSDGLPTVLPDARIAELMASAEPADLPELLVHAALEAGGPDNVTVGILFEEKV